MMVIREGTNTVNAASDFIEHTIEKILIDFNHAAEKQEVWFTIDASGLKADLYGAGFEDTLLLALETALFACVNTLPPVQRYISLKSKRVGNEVFIKISYTRSGVLIKEEDDGYKLLDLKIKNAGGYLKIKNEEEQGTINFVMSCW